MKKDKDHKGKHHHEDRKEKEHPDITYLKQDEIGLVISKALSEVYKVQPRNPVEFFAKYLLNFSKNKKQF